MPPWSPGRAPLRVVVDDSLWKPSGRKVFGATWHHDPTAPGRKRVAWGNAWVVVGVLVDLPCIRHRSLCLPVLARLWRPKQTATRLELAIALVRLVAEPYPDRAVHLVGDAAYAGSALRQLPEQVTVTTRLRCNAALYAPPTTFGPAWPPAPQGQAAARADRAGRYDQHPLHPRPGVLLRRADRLDAGGLRRTSSPMTCGAPSPPPRRTRRNQPL